MRVVSVSESELRVVIRRVRVGFSFVCESEKIGLLVDFVLVGLAHGGLVDVCEGVDFVRLLNPELLRGGARFQRLVVVGIVIELHNLGFEVGSFATSTCAHYLSFPHGEAGSKAKVVEFESERALVLKQPAGGVVAPERSDCCVPDRLAGGPDDLVEALVLALILSHL